MNHVEEESITTMRKRFIAGAICPRCHSQDTLAVGKEAQAETVVCVKCGYRRLRPADEPAAAELRDGKVIAVFRPE